MKNCLNCSASIRNTDKYCRNCGIKIHKNSYYIICNIFIISSIVLFVFIILLFVVSYFV